jgi:molybdenum-dependent DNA-binding transcriptional regulator ModE
MDINSPDLPNMYFRKNIRKDLGEISMDAGMVQLLMAIDEHKPMAQVARDVGMNMATLRQTLGKLLNLGLIEAVSGGGPRLDQAFLGTLRNAIINAVGPIGEFLVEDVAAEMGLAADAIPISRAPDLIVNLAREIPNEALRLEFERSMIKVIPKV